MLDQLEQGFLRPVDVLEEQHERLHLGERHHDLARGPRDLLGASLPFERFEHSGGEAEDVGDGLLLAALTQLRECLLEWVVVGDPGRGLDHLGERPVRDALAVGQAAPRENAGALETVHELAGETALADPGLAEDGEEVRAPVPNGARERVLEELELGLTADERRAWTPGTGGPVDRVHETPGSESGAHALQLQGAGVLDHQACACEAIRGGPDQDLTRPRRLLEARGEVDRLAWLRTWTPSPRRPARRPRYRFSPPGRLLDGLTHGKRRASSALGIVLVSLRDAERRQHRISGELLHDPAVQRDAVRDLLEEHVHAATNDLRIRGGYRPVESTRSMNKTVASFRSMA